MMMIEMCIAEIILVHRLKGMGWKRIWAIKIPVSDVFLMKILVIKDNVDDLDYVAFCANQTKNGDFPQLS